MNDAAWATIAGIACYPCVALASKGEVPLDDLPNVQTWIRLYPVI
jgi:hypothetical protein